MPLNGSDVASRVPGKAAVANTTILSDNYNAEILDIYGILNTVRTVPSGHTGASSFPSGNVLVGNGTSAIQATQAAPTGDFVGTTDTQTLTNKTMTAPTLNSPAIVTPTGAFVATANIIDAAVTVAKTTYATTANFRANTSSKLLTTDQTWAAGVEVQLTDASSIAVDMSTFINAYVTLGGNRTLANPTNAKPGQSGLIRFIQDGTGSRTLTLASNWKTANGNGITLSTGANDVDYGFYHVVSASVIVISFLKDVS